MNYQQLINYRNSQNTFAVKNGIRTVDVSEGFARCELQLDLNHFNIINSVHGGALFTLMDSVGGACATSYGSRVTAVSSSVEFLNAVREPIKLIGVARTAKSGKRVIVVNTLIEDELGKVYAKGVFTYLSLDSKRLEK